MESIGELLDREIKKRSFITNQDLDLAELFEKEKAAGWIKKLLVSDEVPELEQRINAASPERLAHAIAAFLFGIAVREELGLNFDLLPRMFSFNAAGDAFYFFWSVICLCHDFGYQYEIGGQSVYKQELMDTHEGRCVLLGIEHDLFELNQADLQEFGLKEGERQWVEDSLQLVIRYDRMRRRTKDSNKEGAVIDHGIAGALILYDLLIKQFEYRAKKTSVVKQQAGYRDPAACDTAVHTGEIPANAASERFAACCILIACTVARHNIWNVSGDEIIRYQNYDLGMLREGSQDALVSAEDPCGQMLFLLDYMDTIDPVKVFYTRKMEKMQEQEKAADIASWRTFLLDKVMVGFQDEYCIWDQGGIPQKYCQFSVSIKESAECSEEELNNFKEYAESAAQMTGWLKTKPPVCERGVDGRVRSLTCFYPFFDKEEREWIAGITDHEIAALCLYEGCGGNRRASAFYQNPNMYQTLNLIMMCGLTGEEARICQEGQNPDGCYIREWKETLEIMTDIVTAQGKYMKYRREYEKSACGKQRVNVVYRVDRQANYDLMHSLNRTFAFMSTSKAEFLKGIADSKKELVLLELTYGNINSLYIDYEEVLKDDYVYINEQEILFPPFLELKDVQECELTEDEKKIFESGRENKVRKYKVYLGGFMYQEEIPDEQGLIKRLNQNKEMAASVLDRMRMQRTIKLEDEKLEIYTQWKHDFQQLAWNRFSNIFRAYGV